jgi:hydroxymethylglutaryl-CoA synthase
VSAEPRVLEIDLQRAGCFTQEISDTFRPTATSEVMNDSTSVYSYLDALEGAFDDYERRWGSLDYQRAFKKHIYHAPFPGMPRLAHRRLLARCGVEGKAAANRSFEETVAPSLRFARRLGSMYGSSNFVSLMGLLATADDVEPGDPISLFSYGSGCQGEFYGARIGEEARQQVRSLDLDGHLDARVRLDVAAYEANERARDAVAERRDGSPLRDAPAEAYERAYAGRQLLVLDEVAGFQRRYTWS